MDQFTLAFSKIKIEYKEQKADGSLGAAATVGWDVKANKRSEPSRVPSCLSFSGGWSGPVAAMRRRPIGGARW